MKIIPKLQRGDVIASDNTRVVRPEVHEAIKAKPRQYSFVDLGGEPSNDNRSAAERNKNYWHPIKGAKERFKSSMKNETNPLIGIERTILPSAAGAALVTTPAAVIGGVVGGTVIDNATGGWGEWLEDKTGIPSELGMYTNPGALYGGAKGYKIGKNKLLSKFIKGDADLAWNALDKNHWIFNKEARTPANVGMAIANRIAPFLQGPEKLPMKVAAYQVGKRTKGNASVTMEELKNNPSDYGGASILGGGSIEGRNLLAQYIFGKNPIIKKAFFSKATRNIKPVDANEAKRGFSHGDRYEELYPGVHSRRYKMESVVKPNTPLRFNKGVSEFIEYAGENPIGKIIGKEGDHVMRMGDNKFMIFRNPGTNFIGPIDDVGGHVVKFQMNKGKLKQTTQDLWKFNPADYTKRWGKSPDTAEKIRLTKQAALMDKAGTPFILQQSNPIWIEGRAVRDPGLVTMKAGGKFAFKKSPMVKDAEQLNGKRDMRKKFVKSSRPTYKKRIRKAQQGMRFVNYNVVENPTIDYKDITNPTNPFSEYNFNTTYNTPQGLVVPTREDSKPDTVEETPVIANNPTVEPVVNKPVTKTAKSTWKSPYTNRKQWTTELINAYKKAGITNDNAIRMLLAQDALESSWGKSAQGKYNFGNLTTGSSWKGDYVTGNDKNAKGEAIKQKFRSYNSMDEYAADKIQFLKRLYDFDENDDINKFVAKLTGSNKGKRRYAEAKEYANSLRGVYNSFREGGIIKYQNPAQPIARRDATYISKPNVPNRIRKATPAERIQSMINIYGQSEQPVVTSDTKSPWQHQQAQVAASKGYDDYMQAKKYEEGLHNLNGVLTFTDYATLATGLGSLLSKGASVAGKQVAKQAARRAVGKEFKRQSKRLATPNNMLPNNVGWGPRQTIKGAIHDKGTMSMPKLYYPERWDAINEGAPKAGVWFQGRLGTPRNATNTSIANKVEKAANARDLFAKRPVRVEGDLELNKPLVTVGDVPNRAQIQKAADTMGGDGVIFNNVYDNGYGHNQVIFSYRTDLKNGKMFKKGTQPLEKSQFIDTGTSMNGDLDINKNMQNFVDYLLNPETQQRIASIDTELGTKYGEAINRFIKKHKSGDLTVLPRNKGDIGLDNDIIKFSRSVPSEEILTTKDFDRIAFEILRDDFAHVPGHEAKHGIETVQAALLRDMTPAEYHQYAKTGGPRLQALMKDNIVSEDEFVKRIMREHPDYNEVSVRNKYKYLTIPSEFNSQLHPLIEFEQRAGKSGVPNFKSVDEIDRLINNNPYVGTGEKNGLRNLRLLFNYIIKDKNEFMRRFNKYGFGVVPATTAINSYNNE